MLELDGRRHVEDGDEEPQQGERGDGPAAHLGEEEQDAEIEQVHGRDRQQQTLLGDQAREHRVRRVLRAQVRLGVDAFLEIEVVVDHVAGGVRRHEAHERDAQVEPVGVRGARGQQPAEQAREQGHRDDAGARDQQPARQPVHGAIGREILGAEDLAPVVKRARHCSFSPERLPTPHRS